MTEKVKREATKDLTPSLIERFKLENKNKEPGKLEVRYNHKRKADKKVKGLVIELWKTGSLTWSVRFQVDNKWTMGSIGTYADITVERARAIATAINLAVMDGRDAKALLETLRRGNASLVEQARVVVDEIGPTVGEVFKLWAPEYKSDKMEKTQDVLDLRYNKHIKPHWENLPIRSIKADEIVRVLKLIHKATPTTAHRIHNNLKNMWDFAVRKEILDKNIFHSIKAARDVGKKDGEHFPAITDPVKFGQLLRDIDSWRCGEVVRIGLILSAHCFVRSSELRLATWSEIDFSEKIWSIPASRMKMKIAHIVPLSSQVIGYLKVLRGYAAGELLFPSPNSSTRQISNNILNYTLQRNGYGKGSGCEHVQHGFRATARTLLDDRLRYPIDIIEHQLAHRVADTNGRAYNRTQKLEERALMMQQWSDYLDDLKKKE